MTGARFSSVETTGSSLRCGAVGFRQRVTAGSRASPPRHGTRTCGCSTGTWPRRGSRWSGIRSSRWSGSGELARGSASSTSTGPKASTASDGAPLGFVPSSLGQSSLSSQPAWLRRGSLGTGSCGRSTKFFPHESFDHTLERRGARLLARSCDLLVAHDDWTAEQARSELETGQREIVVVPHGSYIGAYSEGRSRSEVRSELGLPQDSFVFLCFGELRGYKEIELLLAAFSSALLPDARLVVAGNAKMPSVGSAVRAASANDSRILSMLGFVPEERVTELFHACDAAVLPRGDGGTSGSLILALSMGLPVVAADVPTVRELTRDGEAGWLFRPHDLSSLRTALGLAASDPRQRASAVGVRWRSPSARMDGDRAGVCPAPQEDRGLARIVALLEAVPASR